MIYTKILPIFQKKFSLKDFSLNFFSESTSDGKKRPRTAFTPEQVKRLESEFQSNKYLSVGKRLELSRTLKLTETQVNTSCILPRGNANAHRHHLRNILEFWVSLDFNQKCFFGLFTIFVIFPRIPIFRSWFEKFKWNIQNKILVFEVWRIGN